MNAKHQFKYSYNETDLEEYSPLEVTFEVPATATLTQMLNNFEQYLKAVGYVFDGKLNIVDEGFDDTIWPSDSNGWDNEVDWENVPQGGCMADFDKECGCKTTSSPTETKSEKLLREWNEGIAKLDNEQLQKAMKEAHEMSGLHYEATKDEVKKNKWVHGICNPPSSDWKATNHAGYDGSASAHPKEYSDWLNKLKKKK